MSTTPSRSKQQIAPITALTSSSLSELVTDHPTIKRIKMLAYLRGGGATAEPAASTKGKGKGKPKAGAKKKGNTNKKLPGTPPAIGERKRPGTSGTELDLRTNRMEASSAFLAAQKAEREYRARRQAKIARDDVEVARVHLGEATKQFRAGVAALTTAIRLMPAVMREKNSQIKEQRAKEKAEREEKAKK
ncbi:hypothetical protein HYFRA_00009128, partial [Hymenoscyphus fraxineus]